MNKNIKQYIDEVFEMWFELKAIRNKNLDLRYKINNEFLNVQCGETYKQRRFNYNYHAFQSNYIYHCYEVMLTFEASEEEWRQMVEEVTQSPEQPQGKAEELSKYIYSRAKWDVLKEHDAKFSRRVRNGDKHAKVFLNPSNFSDLVNDDGEAVPIDLMIEQGNESDYKESFIQAWFRERKEDILTESQIEFLDALEEANHLLLEDDTNEEVERITKTYRSNIDSKLQRIADRLIKAFKEDYPELNLRFNNKPRLRSKLIELDEGVKYAEIINTLGHPIVYEDENIFKAEEVQVYTV